MGDDPDNGFMKIAETGACGFLLAAAESLTSKASSKSSPGYVPKFIPIGPSGKAQLDSPAPLIGLISIIVGIPVMAWGVVPAYESSKLCLLEGVDWFGAWNVGFATGAAAYAILRKKVKASCKSSLVLSFGLAAASFVGTLYALIPPSEMHMETITTINPGVGVIHKSKKFFTRKDRKKTSSLQLPNKATEKNKLVKLPKNAPALLAQNSRPDVIRSRAQSWRVQCRV